MTTTDYMLRAFELAKLAEAEGEVPVGAVIVDPATGDIVAEGYNQPIMTHDPTAHAEIVAIRKAAEKLGNYRIFGLDLYVTLEPCSMCAGAIANARLSKVIFAAEDVKGGAVVNGVRFFDQATCHWHPEIERGLMAEDCSELLRSFFRRRRKSGADQMMGSESQSE